MRSYIFTPTERKAIENLLAGRIGLSDDSIRNIRSRVKNFGDLARDVDLYLRIRETKTATST